MQVNIPYMDAMGHGWQVPHLPFPYIWNQRPKGRSLPDILASQRFQIYIYIILEVKPTIRINSPQFLDDKNSPLKNMVTLVFKPIFLEKLWSFFTFQNFSGWVPWNRLLGSCVFPWLQASAPFAYPGRWWPMRRVKGGGSVGFCQSWFQSPRWWPTKLDLRVRLEVTKDSNLSLRIMGSQVPGGLEIPDSCEKTHSNLSNYSRVQWFLGLVDWKGHVFTRHLLKRARSQKCQNCV